MTRKHPHTNKLEIEGFWRQPRYDLVKADRIHQLSISQLQKIMILEAEAVVRLRERSIDRGKLEHANDFEYWHHELPICSHKYQLETDGYTPFYLRDFLKREGKRFTDMQPVLLHEDWERLRELKEAYYKWLRKTIKAAPAINNKPLYDALQAGKVAIDEVDHVLVTAGAGMGVDSGLPDFRGENGFWKANPGLEKYGLSFQDLANASLFDKEPLNGSVFSDYVQAWKVWKDDPERADFVETFKAMEKLAGVREEVFNDWANAWGFYSARLSQYRGTVPHFGFNSLKYFLSSKKSSFVYTSNVDGHFQKAGFDPDQIVECHGSINHLQCNQPCSNKVWSAEGFELSTKTHAMFVQTSYDEQERYDDRDEYVLPAGYHYADERPKCPNCGGMIRPNILMFNDFKWVGDRSDTQLQKFEAWKEEIKGQRVVVLEIGAGTALPTIRLLSESFAKEFNAKLIRINPNDYDGADIAIRCGAKEALSRWVDRVIVS